MCNRLHNILKRSKYISLIIQYLRVYQSVIPHCIFSSLALA